ncbi:conserved hypothetical protein [Talaromyces stipitatus ATCC 10500]|uniref:DDE-1 domain-containing protein n=1 Tax=Talaromyces stipitatus (strain ATCC 10500 / CBS 375.48 / QM 6759 / NRRL 1006) TaxID=441959 RepID=B8MJS8_TALSN|nr:uncharacterized protein TSTA_042200 [Talaromyces stipitatus ATCC 10500]EED14745.1 conserved hypothetical protein [Talaromyces stipitatus ATCC 10500]
MVNEADILKAISDLESQKEPQYAKTARKYNLEPSTLRRRYKGQTASNQEATSMHRKLLTDAQEEVLLNHISKLSSRGLPPTPQILRNLVVELIQHDVGDPSNIYNFDEKGFNIGLCRTEKRIISKSQLRSKKLLGAIQDGSTEFITLIACICANRATTNSRIRGRYRLLILDGHGSHLTPQFDRICAENDIIPVCMPAHSSHLLQPLDVGCFAVLKRAYGRVVSDLARNSYNHIDKLDFLADYPRARIKAFQPSIIQNSFAATGLVPINPERVLLKLNISLRTPTPPSSRPSSRSSQFTPKTPKTAVQLQKQASMLKELLKQRSNSPPSPSKIILDQIIKGHYQALHHTALLAQENANLRIANEKKCRKRNRSTRQIVHEGGLSVEEGLQLAQQENQQVEGSGLVSHEQGALPTQQDQPRRRALPKCSGCGDIGHKINQCKNR